MLQSVDQVHKNSVAPFYALQGAWLAWHRVPMRASHWIRTALALGGCLLLACQAKDAHLQVAARIQAPAIRECSGIIASRQHDGVFWVHNDSGNAPQLFAVDAEGRLLCTLDVQGVRNTDWEDLTTDDQGNLYVGDFGNNNNNRRDLQVLVVREPDPLDCDGGVRQVQVVRRIPFHFPEQTQYPNPELRNFDCESMFWLQGSLYVFTKHRSDSRTVLYRLPDDGETAAVRLGVFDAMGMVTAASVSLDDRWLVVLTYDYVHLFELSQAAASLGSLAKPVATMALEGKQCEAICFDGDTLVIVNEQREIYRIPRSPWPAVLLPASPVARVHLLEEVAPAEVPWGKIDPLPLLPEYDQGRAPDGPAPTLRLGRSARSLYVQVAFGRSQSSELENAGSLLVSVGPDQDRHFMVSVHEDLEYKVVRQSDAWSVRSRTLQNCDCADRQAHDQAYADASVVDFDAPSGVLAVRLPLHEHLVQQPQALRVNIIVRQPAEASEEEWAWGATSSTWPAGNALLWGRLESRAGH